MKIQRSKDPKLEIQRSKDRKLKTKIQIPDTKIKVAPSIQLGGVLLHILAVAVGDRVGPSLGAGQRPSRGKAQQSSREAGVAGAPACWTRSARSVVEVTLR